MSQTEPLSQFVSEILEMWEANCGRTWRITESDRILSSINLVTKEGFDCLPESKL